MRETLEETLRLLFSELHLFTLVALTVWLPAHVLLKYLEFFAPPEVIPGRAFRVSLIVQIVFDPLVVAATLMALARIKQKVPLAYWTVMHDGARAWGRLFVVRLLLLALLVALMVSGAAIVRSGWRGVLPGALFLAAATASAALLVRFAVVDAVVVLEGRSVFNCWPRAAELTAGRRWVIVRTTGFLLGLAFALEMLNAQLLRAVPELDHFVTRVLFDCAMSVGQTVFTIALFLFYWRGQARAEPA